MAFVRRSECVPKSLGSSPTLPIHSETRRGYCRVVILRSAPRRPVNKNIVIDRLVFVIAKCIQTCSPVAAEHLFAQASREPGSLLLRYSPRELHDIPNELEKILPVSH